MTVKSRATMVFFAPHPDDESLGCGGTIIRRLREGYNVKLVVMTDGSHSHSTVLNIHDEPTPTELARIRKEELLNAVNILGISNENVLFLEFEDGTLQVKVNEVIQKVIDFLKQESNLVRIYATHEKDNHRDHKATGHIIREAVARLKLDVPIYSYVIWQGEKLDNSNHLIEDIEDVLHIKINAIDQYESQIDLFTKRQTRPVLLPEFVNRFKTQPSEEFWITK